MFPAELWERVLQQLQGQLLLRRTAHWKPLHQELNSYRVDLPDNFFFLHNLHRLWWFRIGKYGENSYTGFHAPSFSQAVSTIATTMGPGHLYALREDGVLLTLSWTTTSRT